MTRRLLQAMAGARHGGAEIFFVRLAMALQRVGETQQVLVRPDPDEPSYVAKDTKSGLSVLRHQDSARLRAMCDRIGWQVVDG